MEGIHAVQRHRRIRHMLSEKPLAFRWAMYLLILLWILYFGVFENRDFIYFQF